MNTSIYSPGPITSIPPAFEQLGHDIVKAIAFLLVPAELLYFAIYFHCKRCFRTYHVLNFLSLAMLWLAPFLAPVSCGAARCLHHLAIAIGTMKLLDFWARRENHPTFTAGPKPADWKLALIILTELRYESFTPNQIRVPKNLEKFDEPTQLAIHAGAFAVLQAMPQFPPILAMEVLLSIYVMWTSIQLLVRYKSSPALFGPLYRGHSLAGFWSESWHNAFASPCMSLAYAPFRYGLPKYGVPVGLARVVGLLGVFAFMAMFHMYALSPILGRAALGRIGTFFFINGIATVTEGAIWGRKDHWVKTLLAWSFETVFASWTVSGLNIPHGLWRIPWADICNAQKY